MGLSICGKISFKFFLFSSISAFLHCNARISHSEKSAFCSLNTVSEVISVYNAISFDELVILIIF